MTPASRTVALYHLKRGGKIPAEVIVFSNGTCVVNWRTSVGVYQSEADARAVHIDHMGGRGEVTEFEPVWASNPMFMRAYGDAYQDRCEGCWWASVGATKAGESAPPFDSWTVPDYATTPEDRLAYLHGYAAFAWPQETSDGASRRTSR